MRYEWHMLDLKAPAGRALRLLLALGVLLPIYGPWLDGNFAARQPAHDHLFLGDANPHHGHSHDAPAAAGENGCLAACSVVVNLPGQDLAPHLRALSFDLGAPDGPAFEPAQSGIAFPLLVRLAAPGRIDLPAPDQPPRPT
ncbi:MAG: hypothetical protein ACRDHL_05255 [Candidatus Promineifilaceae bacterium]